MPKIVDMLVILLLLFYAAFALRLSALSVGAF